MSVDNKGFPGPMPSPGFRRAMAANIEPALVFQQSGTLTANKNFVLGSPRRDGQVVDAYLSLGVAGKDNTNPLACELEVTIDGTSIFTTKPKITHVSGEASGMKSTVNTGGSGITSPVFAGSDAAFSAGDVFMGKLTVTRTASPTTEMANVAVVVILAAD